MSTDAVVTAWRQVLRLVLGQLGAVFVTAAALALSWGSGAAMSAVAGGGIGIVATAYLLVAMLRRRLRVGSGTGMVGVFASWLVKTLLTIGLLLAALRSQAFLPPALLAGLLASLIGYWLSLVLSRVEHADRVAGK